MMVNSNKPEGYFKNIVYFDLHSYTPIRSTTLYLRVIHESIAVYKNMTTTECNSMPNNLLNSMRP